MRRAVLSALLPSLLALGLLAAGCAPRGGAASKPDSAAPTGRAPLIKVLAVHSVLADLARNLAGQRAEVATLIPLELDPHSFEPTPSDARKIAESAVLVVNGAGMEGWLEPVLKNAGGSRLVIEAAKGLKPRRDPGGEETDPHFWFDPLAMLGYLDNIRAGLSQADPAGGELYSKNAADYAVKLKELDAWIAGEVGALPAERRLLVTNHESFGYFAERYGFRLVGALIPSVSTGSTPSARELKALIEKVRAAGAPAVFVETGENPDLARQLARETGMRVVTDLYTHSLSAPDGPAPDYLALMKHNTRVIVNALK